MQWQISSKDCNSTNTVPGEDHRRHFWHHFNVIYKSFSANVILLTHSMYIYLLICYHCNIALVVLHFVNFDNFLIFPNRNIDCFRTPMHTLSSSSPLDTNHMKQSQLGVNTCCERQYLLTRRRSKHLSCFFCLDEGRKCCGNLRCALLVNRTILQFWVSGFEE